MSLDPTPTAMLRALSGVRGGRLEIADAGGLHRFGPQDAELRARIEIADRRAYRWALRGSTGFGEGYVDGLWDTDDLLALCRIACRSLPPLDRLRARFAAAAAPRCRTSPGWSRATPAAAPTATSPPTTTSARRCSRPSSTRGWSTRAACSRTSGRRSRRRSWRSWSASAPRSTSRKDDHLLEIGTGWGGLADPRRGDPRLPGDDDDDLPPSARLRDRAGARRGARRPSRGPAHRLPRPHRHLRQAGLDRDDRGRRLAVLPDVLRALRGSDQAGRGDVPAGDRDRRPPLRAGEERADASRTSTSSPAAVCRRRG